MLSYDGRQTLPLRFRFRLPSAMARDTLMPVMRDSSCALLGAVPAPPCPAASVGSSFVAPVKPNRSLRLSLLAEAPFRPPLPADGRSASRAAGACQADDSLSVAHGKPWPPLRETSALLSTRLSKDRHPPEDASLRLHHLASNSRPRRAPCAHQARLG